MSNFFIKSGVLIILVMGEGTIYMDSCSFLPRNQFPEKLDNFLENVSYSLAEGNISKVKKFLEFPKSSWGKMFHIPRKKIP